MALGLLLLGAVAAPPSYAQGVPDEFPGFSLADTAGQIHTLEDYAGQPKLVMFWATWCPYCKKLFPLIKQIHADHSAAGLAVIAISVRDDGDVAAYVEEYGLKMDVLLEGDALADSLGVPGTPAVLVVDADNQIIFATTNSDPDDPTLNRAALAVLQQP
ncbi:MAG: TlpA disulfide reductase family protein [Pseudomonadota bacterium]